jgi:hypothetical protein
MTWFWVLLGKYFDKRNHKEREPESQIFLTKAPKTFGEMSTEERAIFLRYCKSSPSKNYPWRVHFW